MITRQAEFEYAIKNRLKVEFQMTDTPEDKLILFHPYATLNDLFDGISIIGLVEKHHTDPKTNYIARPTVKGVKKVKILSDHFQPNHELWKGLQLGTIDLLLKA